MEEKCPLLSCTTDTVKGGKEDLEADFYLDLLTKSIDLCKIKTAGQNNKYLIVLDVEQEETDYSMAFLSVHKDGVSNVPRLETLKVRPGIKNDFFNPETDKVVKLTDMTEVEKANVFEQIQRLYESDLDISKDFPCNQNQTSQESSLSQMSVGESFFVTNTQHNGCLRCCKSFYGGWKDIGHRTAIFTALIPALIGALFWHPYVRVIIVALLNHMAGDIAKLQTCKGFSAKGILTEINRKIDELNTLHLKGVENLTSIIDSMHSGISNDIVCKAAGVFGYVSLIGIPLVSFLMWFGIYFFITGIRLIGNRDTSVWRPLCLSAVLSVIVFGCGLICLLFDYQDLCFFTSSFIAGLFSHYIFTAMFLMCSFGNNKCYTCLSVCCQGVSIVLVAIAAIITGILVIVFRFELCRWLYLTLF